VHLQCARWKNWKLHVARYNSATYSAAPVDGRKNLPLRPELYNLEIDPDESYDVAAENPEVVKEIQSRIERLMAGFPENIRKDWADTKAMETAPSPAGQWTRPKPRA
jgi:hypothetical protein